jgi:hypothetical protein
MKKTFAFSALAVAFLPLLASAQTTLFTIFGAAGGILGLVIRLAFALALLYFVWGVVKYVIADTDGKSDAKGIIIRGIIGLFVIVSVWGLVGVLQSTIGVGSGGELRQNQIPSVDIYN